MLEAVRERYYEIVKAGVQSWSEAQERAEMIKGLLEDIKYWESRVPGKAPGFVPIKPVDV